MSQGCEYCDSPGGPKTRRNQACMPINGRVCYIDHCISRLVAALNAGGVPTVASCCGHNRMPGVIDLMDGRTLLILKEGLAQRMRHSGEQKTHPSTIDGE